MGLQTANEYQQEILWSFRKAAEQDQLELCRDNLRRLLPDVDRNAVLNIILSRVRRFLIDLSNLNPEDDELRLSVEGFQDITSLEGLDTQGQRTNAFLEKYWSWPGSAILEMSSRAYQIPNSTLSIRAIMLSFQRLSLVPMYKKLS